jgi:hypothetical protein
LTRHQRRPYGAFASAPAFPEKLSNARVSALTWKLGRIFADDIVRSCRTASGKHGSRHVALSQYCFSFASGKRDTVLGWVTNRNWEGK